MIDPKERLNEQEWYQTDIPRKEFRAYLTRKNGPALLSFGTWLALLGVLGWSAVASWGSWWAIPLFVVYGIVYASSNNRWHECSHGTPFRANWLNNVFYFAGGSMEFRDFIEFRWSHSRHHSYTMMSVVDPEIPLRRPPNWTKVYLDFFYLYSGTIAIRNLVLHSLGIVAKGVREYVPEDEFKPMFWWARAALLPHILVIGLSVYLNSWIPVLLYGLPRFYGACIQWVFIMLQHAGLEENVWDHRVSCRSFRLNPVLSFLLMNMENHIEHHMYPLVPFHALPALSKRLRPALPEPYRGLWAPLRELFPVLSKQKNNPDMSIPRPLPTSDCSDPTAQNGSDDE